MRTMQLAMSARSRREGDGTGDGLRASPREGSVLAVVLSACVIPTHPQGVNMALQCVGEGKAARGWMARVVQIDRLGDAGVNSHGSFGGRVDELRCRDRPFGASAIESDRRRFHA